MPDGHVWLLQVPGVYSLKGPDADRYGHRRLRALLAGSPPAQQVAAQVSSVSDLSADWLADFEASLNLTAHVGKTPGSAAAKTAVYESGSNGLAIVFPSEATAIAAGVGGAGFLTVSEQVAGKAHLAKRFRELVLQEGATSLCHSKIFVGCGPMAPDGNEGARLWVLCGSHNLSMAAWGARGKGDFFEIKHYELGTMSSWRLQRLLCWGLCSM